MTAFPVAIAFLRISETGSTDNIRKFCSASIYSHYLVPQNASLNSRFFFKKKSGSEYHMEKAFSLSSGKMLQFGEGL